MRRLMMGMVLNAGREINSDGEVYIETCLHELMERVLLFQLVMIYDEMTGSMSLLIQNIKV